MKELIMDHDLAIEKLSLVLDGSVEVPFCIIVGMPIECYSRLLNAADDIMYLISRWKTTREITTDEFARFIRAELLIFGKSTYSNSVIIMLQKNHTKRALQVYYQNSARGEVYE
jgi:hypothetical protein